MLSNAQFESSNYYDYVVEGYVDSTILFIFRIII